LAGFFYFSANLLL